MIKKVPAIALSLLFPLFASANLNAPTVDPCSETYQIKEFKPVDPRGDFCIAELGLRIGKQVLNIILRHQTLKTSADSFNMGGESKKSGPVSAEEQAEELLNTNIDNSNLQIEGIIEPIRPLKLVEMFGQVMLEENQAHGFKTHYGEIQRWSDEFLRNKEVRKRYHVMGRFYGSKILTALSMGAGKRFIPSGKEDQLESWVLAQADNGVTLENIFRQSYILNEGNVYLTILTISNYLSYNWRNPHRADLPFVKKLTSITNRWQGRGDTFGSWYHLFGIMLYGFVKGEPKAKFVARTESIMSYWGSDGEIEEQEDFINLEGAIAGSRLAKLVTVWDFISWPNAPKRKNPQYYLNLTEDFRDRIKYVPDSRFEISEPKLQTYDPDSNPNATYRISIKSLDPNLDTASCKVEIIPKYTTKKRFFSSDLISLNPTPISADGYTSIIFPTSPSLESARVFINCERQP